MFLHFQYFHRDKKAFLVVDSWEQTPWQVMSLGKGLADAIREKGACNVCCIAISSRQERYLSGWDPWQAISPGREGACNERKGLARVARGLLSDIRSEATHP